MVTAIYPRAYAIPLVVVVTLAGCVYLSPEAERVRVVHESAEVSGCATLGPVSRTDPTWSFTYQSWKSNENALRADTAALGGDTLLIRQERFSAAEGPRTVGEAYRCAR